MIDGIDRNLKILLNNESLIMNWSEIEDNWPAFKRNVKHQWGKLTDDQLNAIAGERKHLAGKIQIMYGIGEDEAEYQLSDWQSKQQRNPSKINNIF